MREINERKEPLENDIPKHSRKGKKPPTVANLKHQISQLERKERENADWFRETDLYDRLYGSKLKSLKEQLAELESK